MKKTIAFLGMLSVAAYSDVVSILPYGGMIDYGNDSKSSYKDSATLYGVHASVGNLSYLLEVDYAMYDAKYKDSTIDNLQQDDITVVYGRYFPKDMFRFGMHYVSTNDIQLGDGIVAIVGVGGYKYYGYDKLSYGVDGYLSYYKEGHSEDQDAINDPTKAITLYQASPYISYYKAINLNWGNSVKLVANVEYAPEYDQSSYFSFEISDTIYYKKAFLTLKYYDGEMRTGVKDEGFTVYNTLDMLKNGYSAKVGITLNQITVALNYTTNTYREYDYFGNITKDNTDSLYFTTLSIGF